jgi:uncharacterized protein
VRVKIDLSKIDNEPLSFDESLQLAPQRLDESQVLGSVSVRLSGAVRCVGGGVFVDGRYQAEGSLACARCLQPVEWRASDQFALEYRSQAVSPSEEEVELEGGDMDVSFLLGESLDLEDVAAEQVLLALPMRIVCDDECAGLCPQCGANRNIQGACSCDPEVDPRWDALRDLTGRDTAN